MDARFALPPDTVLVGAYRIVRVVGQGGFGITYEAQDINLHTTVALKEYYPFDFGDRDHAMSVRPKSERHKKSFDWGLTNFVKEARTLARFDHPSIVRVTHVFEAHSTAYMIMSFERGQSFEAWLKGLERPPLQEELDRIIAPLLDALEVLHATNFLHRDIAPDNIIVRADGTPVLLDFGAARRAVAEVSRALTGIVKAGYSPNEQYTSNSRLQGPWSDLYALGGTLYRAVTGGAPEEATLRVDHDRMAPAAICALGTYRPSFLAAIDRCLRVKYAERPQSVAQVRPMLLGTAEPEESAAVITDAPGDAAPEGAAPATWPMPDFRQRVAIVASVLAVACGAYAAYDFTRPRPAPERVRVEETEQRRKYEDDQARRKSELDAEQQRKDAAEKAAREAAARADAERRQQEERAAEAEARRRADAEAERRRTPDRQGRPQRLDLTVKLDAQPDEARKGRLGVNMEPVERPLALSLDLPSTDGVLLLEVVAGGPAAQAGLRFGDVVLALNGRSFPNLDTFRQRIASLAPGSEAKLEVWRVADGSGFLGTLRGLAEGGNAHAMYRLGRMYAAGVGTTKDEAQAAQWYRKGADAGNASAMTALAVALADGRGVAADRTEALRFLRAAAAQKHSEAMHRLGHVLIEGKIVDKDAVEGTRLLTAAAEADFVPSMVELGRNYANGIGVQADPAKGAMWFKRAADLGNSFGMAGLGALYDQGKGVEKDSVQAVAWYKRAVELDNATAMADLALLHIQGRGVPKSETTAVTLYRRAASLGNPVAYNNLAWMLQRGIGTPKDPEGAADLMMKALDSGNEFSHRQMTQSSREWSREFRQALQRRLKEAGFYTGATDGNFRDTTIAAINAYMKRNR